MGSYHIVEYMIKQIEDMSNNVDEVQRSHKALMEQIHVYDNKQTEEMHWQDLSGNANE